MNTKVNSNDISELILSTNNFLIIQDLDGVCIPLVQDPLKRELSKDYIYSAERLKGKFCVLTCGEHEGKRGVNRLVEKSLGPSRSPSKEGFYLPGLAACGVELQNRFGKISHPGLTEEEVDFLAKVPEKMKEILSKELEHLAPEINQSTKDRIIEVAVCDTRFTPTLNLNELFKLYENNREKIIKLQKMMKSVMESLINESIKQGLENSFHLHMMPNLGMSNGKELMKYATYNDFGTTDIQFIVKGAMKDAGLLVLLNEYIISKTGKAPFGKDFNVKNSPKSLKEMIRLCKEKISSNEMPLLIGVGDTVTSSKDIVTGNQLRGGSDRQFLTLIQELGKSYNKKNQVVFVNSSNNQVSRPKIKGNAMNGISDPEDLLKFNKVMESGPNEYIDWFKMISLN